MARTRTGDQAGDDRLNADGESRIDRVAASINKKRAFGIDPRGRVPAYSCRYPTLTVRVCASYSARKRWRGVR